MTLYPNAIDSTLILPTVPGLEVEAVCINAVRDAVLAIEKELGIKPKGIYVDLSTRLSILESRIGSGTTDSGDSFVNTTHSVLNQIVDEIDTVDNTPLTISETFQIATNSLTTVDAQLTCVQAGATKAKIFNIRRHFLNKNDVITAPTQTNLISPTEIGGSMAASVLITNTGNVGRVEITGISNVGLRWRLDRQTVRITPMSAGVSPTVISATPNSGTDLGGIFVTIDGTNFIDGAEIFFDDVIATSINWINSTQMTCITPAGTAGVASVKVTNPDSQFDTLVGGYTYTSFDPSTLSLTVWVRGSFTASPWLGSASSGSSLGRNFTESTNPPSSGTAVDGKNPATFDGINDQLLNATPISTTLTASAYRRWVLFKATSIATASSLPLAGVNDTILTDSGGYTGITLTTLGGNKVQGWHYQSSSKGNEHAITLGQWCLLCMRYDGVNVRSRLSSGGTNGTILSAAAGNIDLVTGTLMIGRSYDAAHRFTGSVLDYGDIASAGTDAWMNDILDYIRGRYPSAGI